MDLYNPGILSQRTLLGYEAPSLFVQPEPFTLLTRQCYRMNYLASASVYHHIILYPLWQQLSNNLASEQLSVLVMGNSHVFALKRLVPLPFAPLKPKAFPGLSPTQLTHLECWQRLHCTSNCNGEEVPDASLITCSHQWNGQTTTVSPWPLCTCWEGW